MKNVKIQYLRAIAIIAVVYTHCLYYGPAHVYMRPCLNFAVPMFLFLSGYLTKVKVESILQFYKKRILRVLIPYVLWSIINTIPSTSVYQYVYNIATTRSAGNMYYIFVYIQFVLLTPLLGKLATSKYKYYGFLVSPLAIVVFKYIPLLIGYWPYEHLGLVWQLGCFGWFTYYYLGLLLGNDLVTVGMKPGKHVMMMICALLIEVGETYFLYLKGDVECGHQLKLSSLLADSMCIVVAFDYLRSNITSNSRILEVVGDCSFGVYLSHIVVMKVFNKISVVGSLPFPIKGLVIVILATTFVYLGRIVFGKKISRYLGFV